MTTDPSEPQPTESPDPALDINDERELEPPSNKHRSIARRVLGARVGRIRVGGLLAAVALVALIGSAYYIGTPSADGGGSAALDGKRMPVFGAAISAPAATPADGAVPAASGDVQSGVGHSAEGALDSSGSTTTTTSLDPVTTAIQSLQIVKTGSMAIEVADASKAASQAQATIVGMGGSISQSSRSGDKDNVVVTATYRVPVARWEDAIAAMRGLASRIISEQTDATDVTAQAIDLNARLANLQVTETALQSIMAKATAIPDVLAVEQQLSQVEGQIEELKAQQNHLTDQAAMSTLSVSFSTPGQTVTTQAASEWVLGAQVDQAVATLVHIGQGLATIVVWAVIIGLPTLLGLALLAILWSILRRVARRRRPGVAGA
jgi:hypothetical protein